MKNKLKGDDAEEDSMSQELRALPLVEGGLRYTIHPVTGYLITTEVQPAAREMSGPGHQAHREDKAIKSDTFLFDDVRLGDMLYE